MKKTIAFFFLFIIITFTFAQESSETWYLDKPIKDIRFQGLVVVEQKELNPIVDEFKGEKFTDEIWLNILSRVLSLDYFDDASAEAIPQDSSYNSVILVFTVIEKPSINSVVFSGNKGLRSSELDDEISSKEATIFNEKKLRLDEIALRRFYQSKGYPDVSIETSFKARPSGNIDISFTIVEGIQNIVSEIQFEGAEVFSVNSLKNQIPLKEKSLFQLGQFNETQLEESRQTIELYYMNRGYIDCKVIDVKRESITNDKDDVAKLKLTFVINEGQKYIYGGMSFTGNSIYTTEELSSKLKQVPGSVISYEKLMNDQTIVTDLYFENGYIFNNFNLIDTRDDLTGTISYVLNIQERDQAHIEDVIFRGNNKTEEILLKRLMPLQSGDIFSKTKLFEGLKALYNTQYFSAITPEYEQGSQDMFVDLIVNVEEQSTASVQFGLTYSPVAAVGEFPITGVINWSDINFLGKGLKISLETNIAVDEQNLKFSFSDDWLFGKRWSGSVDFSFSHDMTEAYQDSTGSIFAYGDPSAVPDPYTSWEEYNAAVTIPDEYKMKYHEWTFSLGYGTGYRWDFPFGTLGLAPGITHEIDRVTYENNLYRPFTESVSTNLSNWLFTNTVYGRVYLNNLDLWYDPSLGYYASQRLALTGWFNGEANHFIRSDSRLDAFVTLFNIPITETWAFKGILGGHTKFSTLFKKPWTDNITATNSRMLEIDGTFVGRGWSVLNNVYGVDLWESWLELRFPVVPSILSIDGFFDAAILNTKKGLLDMGSYASTESISWESDKGLKDMGLSNFAFSTGFGIRFIIMLFPFRLYLSKRFVYDDSSDSGFSFNNFKFIDSGWSDWEFVLSVTTNLN